MSYDFASGRRMRRRQSSLGLWLLALLLLIAAGGGGFWLYQNGHLPIPSATPSSQAAATRPVVTAAALFRGRTVEVWGKLLLDPDGDVARSAAQALGQMGDEGVPYLVGGLASPLSDVRVASAKALLEHGKDLRTQKDKAVPALIKMLNVGSAEEWRAAVKLLGELGAAARAAISPLEELRDKLEKPADKELVTRAISSITR